MNNLALSLISTIFIGLGATLTTDLWAQFLKRAFNIAASRQKSAECRVGWIAHLKNVYFEYHLQPGRVDESIRWSRLNDLHSIFHNPPSALRYEYQFYRAVAQSSFLIFCHHRRCAGAGLLRITIIAARAGILTIEQFFRVP